MTQDRVVGAEYTKGTAEVSSWGGREDEMSSAREMDKAIHRTTPDPEWR